MRRTILQINLRKIEKSSKNKSALEAGWKLLEEAARGSCDRNWLETSRGSYARRWLKTGCWKMAGSCSRKLLEEAAR